MNCHTWLIIILYIFKGRKAKNKGLEKALIISLPYGHDFQTLERLSYSQSSLMNSFNTHLRRALKKWKKTAPSSKNDKLQKGLSFWYPLASPTYPMHFLTPLCLCPPKVCYEPACVRVEEIFTFCLFHIESSIQCHMVCEWWVCKVRCSWWLPKIPLSSNGRY